MKYLLSILLMISVSVGATSLTIGLNTTHIGNSSFNNDNKLVLFESEQVFVTTFINSYDKRSVATGYKIEKGGVLKYGAYFGVASGYCLVETVKYYGQAVEREVINGCKDIGFPVFAPFVSIGTDNANLSVTVFGQAVITGITLGV